ncbi:MAG: hypothetical protein HQL08_10245 [Nitrospirae bacterium]|nr:hypothetical protein [Nitrospirota bacterium]
MKRFSLFFDAAVLTLAIVVAGFSNAEAMMGGSSVVSSGNSTTYSIMGSGSGANNGIGSPSGMMGGTIDSGMALSSSGMMNKRFYDMSSGIANNPVVASNGTAYVVSYSATSNNASTYYGNYSYKSKINQVTTSGQMTSISVNGIISAPVISGSTLAVTGSLSGYMMDWYNSSSSNQLVLYILSLPFTSSTSAVSVSLEGDFASVPVISGSHIYVTTTDLGITSATKSYLYILNFDGSTVAQVQIQ